MANSAKGPKRALLVVDMQNDFCPASPPSIPDGSLAVRGGRDIAPLIVDLMELFDVKIATQDWHPPNHISFASQHKDIDAKPFVSFITFRNPDNEEEEVESRLWPDHCVQGTWGAELISPFKEMVEEKKFDHMLKKGTIPECETYSAFYSPFRNPKGFGDTGLRKMLSDENVDEVWVVGLAADYCVKNTALDAAEEGFRTFIVEEGTRAVDPEAWEKEERKMVQERGVRVVSKEGSEVRALKEEKRKM